MPDKTETTCEICRKVTTARAGQNFHLIHDFEHSVLVVGDHQFFPGYSVLLAKAHFREPFDLPLDAQAGMFRELMESASAIQAAYLPWKMNYSCYGNQVPHIHWHLFPRYENDPQHKSPPWVHSAEFGKFATTETDAREVARRVGAKLGR
jgi:diadenosine tetraphosphate (Ap4A) HIT family hydrolase